jgi:hypothetical protein
MQLDGLLFGETWCSNSRSLRVGSSRGAGLHVYPVPLVFDFVHIPSFR